MDPPLTPTPGLGDSGALRSSPSSASGTRKCPQQNDYPLSTDSKTGNRPMGGRDLEHAPSTTSEARLEPPAPDNQGAGKTSKTSKRKKNRNRKRRNRHQSFLTPGPEESHDRAGTATGTGGARESMEGDRPTPKDQSSYFKLGRSLSNTSLESDALLDHRYVVTIKCVDD